MRKANNRIQWNLVLLASLGFFDTVHATGTSVIAGLLVSA